MCGRFALVTPVAELKKRFNVKLPKGEIRPHYNNAPGQIMPVIEMENPEQLSLFKWGLVPHWAYDPKIGYRMINARAETVAEKPSFRSSLKKRRCLIPADGFFEWDKKPVKHVPYFIKLKNNRTFAFAGLAAHWEKENEKIDSFTIITTEPNTLIGKIHNRMPVILAQADEKKWLDPIISDAEALKLLKPFPAKGMEAYPISNLVNNPRNDSAAIIKPLK